MMIGSNVPENMILMSSVAAVVSDPRQEDNPIIACNDAFLHLTGYDKEEVIGRNCRFLRGEMTEDLATTQIKNAIENRQPIMAELYNYRKDKTIFLNAVMIAPIFDEFGEIQYFLGSQMEVDTQARDRQQGAQILLRKLTPRQSQVLKALTRGILQKQIAYELSLTERTIKMHRAAMLKTLGVKTNAEAIRIAIEASF